MKEFDQLSLFRSSHPLPQFPLPSLCFQLQLFCWEIDTNLLAFSHPLTNSGSTAFPANCSVSGVCPLEVCYVGGFFAFESLSLLGNRYMEIYSTGIQVVWHGPMLKSVQGVGQEGKIQVLEENLALLFAAFTK